MNQPLNLPGSILSSSYLNLDLMLLSLKRQVEENHTPGKSNPMALEFVQRSQP